MLGGAEQRHQGRAAHRLAWAPRPAGRRCWTWSPARPASSIGTHALIEDKVAVPRPGPGRGRRAAPLRRRAARRPARQGQAAAAPAGHDRHPDPAHGRDDRLRRPGDLRPATSCPPAARRSPRHVVPGRGQAALPGPRLGAGARGGGGRPPGVRGLPAHRRTSRGRRRRRADGEEGRRGGRGRERRPPLAVLDVADQLAEGPLHGLRVEVLHGRMPPDDKDDGDAPLRRRRGGRAGRHHRHRGRRRTSRTPPPW